MGLFRVMLAVLIMVHHLLPNGGVNDQLVVETFFVISGFYMSLILDRKYKDDTIAFYKARYLRLWPGYLLTLVLTVLWFYVHYGEPGKSDGLVHAHSFAEIKNFLINTDWYVKIWYCFVQFFLIGIETINFVNIDSDYHIHLTTTWHPTDRIMPYFFTPVWAVGVELWLYVFAPFLFKHKKFAASLIIPSLIYKHFYSSYPMLSGFLPAELGVFAIGIMGYELYKKFEDKLVMLLNNSYTAIIVYIVIVMTSMIIFITGGANVSIARDTVWLLFVGLLCPIMFTVTKNLKWDNFLGKTSYYLYIGGIFGTWILYLIGWHNTNTLSHILIMQDFIAFSVATFTGCVLCVICIEPLLDKIRFGQNYSKYHLEFKKI